jgi:hypothetical protein
MEAVQIRLLFVDNNWSSIMVHVSVVITLVDDDGFVTVLMITVADDVTVTITIPVTISVTLTNRYANRADTTPHLFRSSRNCAENSSDGGDHYGILNHYVLLSLLSSARAMPRRRDLSASKTDFRCNPVTGHRHTSRSRRFSADNKLERRSNNVPIRKLR